MNRILFLLIVFAAMAGCSSEPVKPKIAAVEVIQYDDSLQQYYVEINQIRFAVGRILIRESKTIEPEAGCKVTCFTTKESGNMQFILGDKTVEEIEAAFYRNFTMLYIFAVVVLAFSWSVFLPRNKKIPVVNAE